MNSTNPDKNRRILIVDDNRSIHDDFRKILSPSGALHSALGVTETALFGGTTHNERQIPFVIDSAYQGQEASILVKKALEERQPYAMAFVDVRMPPGWDGVETTEHIWEIDSEIQIVICTAFSDYSWEEMFERIGNNDRMVILKKPFDTVEVLQMAYALTEKWSLNGNFKRKMDDLEKLVAERTHGLRQSNEDLQIEIVEHKQTELELLGKTAFLNAQVNSSLDGILVVDSRGKKILQNQRMIDIWKMPQDIADEETDENRIQWVANMTENPDQFMEKVVFLNAHPNEISREDIKLKDGTILDRYSSPVVGKDCVYYGRIWVFRDITERKKIETQLVQTQKLETIGKLAGSVAHEFNSILTTIIGQSELLINDLPPDDPLGKGAREIRKAANSAATLTRQLLAYGRKQILKPEILDLNLVLTGMISLLQHLMGKEVDVRIVPAIGLKTVKIDPGQMEQVILNIAMNAADAMPNGGKLTLKTSNVTLDEEFVRPIPGLKAGGYVMLTITDTGVGMSEGVKARVFEPFFSTKGVGEGTGLGLATCYGILKQSDGHINMDSEVGQGATFKIYLPQVERQASTHLPRLNSPDFPRGTETILLAEDDPSLLEMSANLLRRLGYTVLTAANGVEALNHEHQGDIGHIDLLFTDVIMPHMSGKELADRIRAMHPRTKILFTSAYTESDIVQEGMLNEGVSLLQKPFAPSALASKIREVLDQ